jgi:hypothetical protein
MSKKFLKHQAEELLSSELIQIKGGIDPLDEVIEGCSTCDPGCMVCTSCNKKA